MSFAIIVDTGVLSFLTTKLKHPEGEACRAWMRGHIAGGNEIAVPEIADFELRRELLRASKTTSIERLNLFNAQMRYLPLHTAAIRRAAELWADARNQGLPTAGNEALDGDILICAQVLSTDWGQRTPIIATTNPAHLSRFVRAERWQNVPIPAAPSP